MAFDEEDRAKAAVAELRTEMVQGFGEIKIELAEFRTYLIGIDGRNGLRGELRALREEVVAHVSGDTRIAAESRQEKGKREDRRLEDKKSRRILLAAVIAALLASPILTRLTDQVFPEKIHATETAEARGPTVIQGEVK